MDYTKLKALLGISLSGAVLLFSIGWFYHSTLIESYHKTISSLKEKLRPFTAEDYRGLTWHQVATSTPWEARDSAEAYEWNGALYLFGGLNGNGTLDKNGLPQYDKAKYFNDIWKTSDGEHWELVTASSDLPQMRAPSIIPFKGTLYLYGGWGPSIGHNPSIWKSRDGEHWEKVVEKAPFPGREGDRVLEHDGTLYLVGGVNYDIHTQFNDVWTSTDGTTWTPLTQKAGWHGRWDHDLGFINENFWLVSGMSSASVGYDDIWKSPDGKDWTLVATSTALGKRQGHVILPYRGALWLVGGLDTKSNKGIGDTWFTTDGEHWEKTTTDGGWVGREDHRVVVFKGKMWLFAGMDTNWHWTNDIWYAELAR